MSSKSNATLKMIVQGADGVLTAMREAKLPFIPCAGMCVDGQKIIRADWQTKEQRWVLTLEGHTQIYGCALDNFAKLVSQPNEWKKELKETGKAA